MGWRTSRVVSRAKPGVAYRVGSIRETFTAAVVLGLAERDVLALDAPVGRYLPGTPFAQVPLRMVLAHCGGLPREVPGDMWSSIRSPGPRELREAFAAVEPVARPGGAVALLEPRLRGPWASGRRRPRVPRAAS